MWTSDSIQYVEEQTCTKHSFSFSILINFAFKSFETRMNTTLNFHYYLVTFSKIKQLGQYHNPSGILYSPTHSKWYHRVLHFVLSQATISPTYCVRQWHSSASSSVDSSSSVVVWESALEDSSILCLQKKIFPESLQKFETSTMFGVIDLARSMLFMGEDEVKIV